MSNITRFEPFREMERMTDEMNRRMNSLLRAFDNDFFSSNLLSRFFNDSLINRPFAPRVDIAEDANNMYLHVELPGMSKEDVSLTVSDDRVLTIKGERKNEHKDEGKNYIRIERVYGEFSRSFQLPDNVKTDSIDAKYENGVLNITLPKTEESKPKQIAVEIK
ncbi:MAG: Hsp20/alpha crystallin family protein [Bacteroidota bacterium]|nr:Hsp20/alpha crystallin family protein [Candidatus Kapabacteria bacterium]MDW8219742.1 Hsp20/alpha crystallin family protein [Bacteroidota bacterium]